MARTARGRRKPPVADQAPALLVLHGGELGRRFGIERAELTLGSAAEADIRLEHETVCGLHARLLAEDGRVELICEDGQAASLVNDQPFDRVLLQHGDRIKLGRVILRYLCDDVERACQAERNWLASYDGLTGLYNQRAFRENLELELKRCLRYGRELSVFIYGVDAIDRVVARNGELAADSLLVQAAGVVGESLSRDDYHARYGQQAFAVILPEVNQAEALMRAEKIRRTVELTDFVWGHKVVEATISIGVATFERHMEDVDDFLRELDRNLYQSTQAGRNRVIGVEGGVTRCS